jgi:hypothetical protein
MSLDGQKHVARIAKRRQPCEVDHIPNATSISMERKSPMSQSTLKNGAGPRATWRAPLPAEHGKLDAAHVNHLPETAFAFPRSRKEPMTDASHVRNAIARFDQVKVVSDEERDLAFANIQAAAEHFGISMKETSWRQFGSASRAAG